MLEARSEVPEARTQQQDANSKFLLPFFKLFFRYSFENSGKRVNLQHFLHVKIS